MMSTCCSKHVEAWNKYITKECVKLVINQKYNHIKTIPSWPLLGCDSVHCGSGLSLFRKSLVSPGWTLNIEAMLLWNADINFQTTWCHTLEDNSLNFHQCKNVSSCTSISCSILSISQHLHAFITSTYWCSIVVVVVVVVVIVAAVVAKVLSKIAFSCF
jgi:hypothetical protein